MCAEGKLDEAIAYLESVPLDAQNTAVWNSLITQAGFAKRFRVVYDLYVDMKRRGLKPNLATYASLMAAFQKVDSWEKRSKLFKSVQNVYKHYLDYLAAVKEHNPTSPEISLAPINMYISILRKIGDYAQAFDVYNALDEDGPLSPDRITYTIMLRTIYQRSITAEDENQEKIRERCASDARLLWRQLTKRLDGGSKLGVDPMVIGSVLQVLALGRPADHIVAFDIIRDYLGLAKPGETALPAQVPLSSPLIQDVLWLCNKAQKYRLCVHFGNHLMDTQPHLLDHGHFDHILTAYGSLSATGSVTEASRALQTLEWMLEREKTHGARLRPGQATYTLVLVVCWRAKDWESALRTVELMTGLHAEDFADGAKPTAADSDDPAPPAKGPGSGPGKRPMPDAAAMSCLVRTALESGDEPTLRQCARLLHRLGLARCLAPAEGSSAHDDAKRTGARFGKDRTFYAHKVAQAVVELVDVLVPRKTESSRARLTPAEREWVALRSEARTFLIEQREHRPRGTPQMEEQPLGSAAGLAAMDSVVEWDRISREQKSAR
ncbi:hypothetical protein C2E23DRAFT_742879 [Lenzites betulinus]|nr:hypothetical protein C2E23DRAFT_742879 [Lenzites betulinus]